MATYSNTSKNSATYSNLSENTSSVLGFLLTEAGEFLAQQDDYLINLDGTFQFNELRKYDNTYTNLSKA